MPSPWLTGPPLPGKLCQSQLGLYKQAHPPTACSTGYDQRCAYCSQAVTVCFGPRNQPGSRPQCALLMLLYCITPHLACHYLNVTLAQNFTRVHGALVHTTLAAQHSVPQHSMAQHSMAQHCMAQHCPAQHSLAQHCMAQHCMAQHSTAQHGTAQEQHDTGELWQSTARHSTARLSPAPVCYLKNSFHKEHEVSQTS